MAFDTRVLSDAAVDEFAACVCSCVGETGEFVRELSLFCSPDLMHRNLPGLADANALRRVLTVLARSAPHTLSRFRMDASTPNTPELTGAFRTFFENQCELEEVSICQNQAADRTQAPVTDAFCRGLLSAGPMLHTITLVKMPSR